MYHMVVFLHRLYSANYEAYGGTSLAFSTSDDNEQCGTLDHQDDWMRNSTTLLGSGAFWIGRSLVESLGCRIAIVAESRVYYSCRKGGIGVGSGSAVAPGDTQKRSTYKVALGKAVCYLVIKLYTRFVLVYTHF